MQLDSEQFSLGGIQSYRDFALVKLREFCGKTLSVNFLKFDGNLQNFDDDKR